MNVFTQAYANNGYIMFNRELARAIGNDAAILFGELCSEYNYFEETGELFEDGSFYSTMENIEERVNLTPYQQRKAINILEEFGLLTTYKKGVPPVRFFILQAQNVEAIFSNVKKLNIQMLNTCQSENIKHSNVKKFNIPNNNYNRDNYNINSFIEEKKENKQINIKDLPPLKALEVYKEEFNLSDEIFESFKDYLDMRKKNGDKLNANIVKRAIMKLQSLSSDPGEQLEIINQSIIGCWSGLFPLKQTRQRQQYKPTTAPIDEGDNVIERLKKKYQAEAEEEERRKNATD